MSSSVESQATLTLQRKCSGSKCIRIQARNIFGFVARFKKKSIWDSFMLALTQTVLSYLRMNVNPHKLNFIESNLDIRKLFFPILCLLQSPI